MGGLNFKIFTRDDPHIYPLPGEGYIQYTTCIAPFSLKKPPTQNSIGNPGNVNCTRVIFSATYIQRKVLQEKRRIVSLCGRYSVHSCSCCLLHGYTLANKTSAE